VEAEDWACLVEYRQDVARQQLTRRIVTFRKVGNTYLLHASFIGAVKVEIDFAQVTLSDWTPDPVIP
jgi:hypothetical protein